MVNRPLKQPVKRRSSKLQNTEVKSKKLAAGHKCEICEKILSTKKNLKRHRMAVHEKLKEFECLTCDKLFSRKWHLKVHMDHGLG